MKIWIDIINPSDVLFFNSVIPEFQYDNIIITLRERSETVGLANCLGISGEVVGHDSEGEFRKALSMLKRNIKLLMVQSFDIGMSFENGMAVSIAKLRKCPSFLFCDNDLKFVQKTKSLQDLETKIKLMADYIVVPQVCKNIFKKQLKNPDKIISYDGYKEDIYIADYKPNANFKEKIPYDNFIVVRPEALGSFYVKEKKSIVPEILKRLESEGINILFLPRENSDRKLAHKHNIYIPNEPLNGLDLSYYADVVLTGSGTMAREAACMGTPSVSFFPSDKLLTVDANLVEQKRMLHSRNIEEISSYVLKEYGKKSCMPRFSLDRSKEVKKEMINKIRGIMKLFIQSN